MTQLKFLIFSDGFVRDEKSPPWIFNPFMTMRFPNIPWAHTFTLVFGIDRITPVSNHKLKVKATSPKGKVVADVEMNIPMAIPAPAKKELETRTRPDGTVDIIGSMDLKNLLFEDEGYYVFSIEWDGNQLGKSNIYVMRERGQQNVTTPDAE